MSTATPKQSPKPTLSLCMIVENEAAMLESCLNSVKNFVDEIIVVGTGSTDNTRSIARDHGANIIRHKWQEDFSAARNESLRHACGDWILFLDADERIDPDSTPIIEEIIKNNDVEGFRFEFINYIEDGSKTIKSSLLRLFRNNGYHFSGKIHEQIEHEISKKGIIKQVSVVVHHLGYLSKVQANKKKASRNLSMLQNALVQSPHDPYIRFQLGLSLGSNSRHEEALLEFMHVYRYFEAVPQKAWPEYAIRSIYLMSKSYYMLGQYETAYGWSSWLLERWKISEIGYQHGKILYELRKFPDALSSFQECLNLGDSEAAIFQAMPGQGDYLAILLGYAGDWKNL